jgi:hypothetical protein
MQMVAASKMRKAQQATLTTRPFGQLLYRMQRHAIKHATDFEHPLLAVRHVRRRAVILVGTDKGLCGSLNTNFCRIAGAELLLGRWQQHIAALHAFPARRQPPRPCEPAVRLGRFISKQELEPQPKGAACGSRFIARFDTGMMSPDQKSPVVRLPAGQVGSRGQPFQIVERQRSRLIGDRERRVAILPCSTFEYTGRRVV